MPPDRIVRYALDLQDYLDAIEGTSGKVPQFAVCLVGAVLQFSVFERRGLAELRECAPLGTTMAHVREWMWGEKTPEPAERTAMLDAIAHRLRMLDSEFRGAGLDIPTVQTMRRTTRNDLPCTVRVIDLDTL